MAKTPSGKRNELTNQGFDIDLESLRAAEIWITAASVQDDLRYALFDQLVIRRPDGGIVSDANEMLQDGQEVALGLSVQHGIRDQMEALLGIGANYIKEGNSETMDRRKESVNRKRIFKLESDVVVSLRELVEVFIFVIVEHFELECKVGVFVFVQHLRSREIKKPSVPR